MCQEEEREDFLRAAKDMNMVDAAMVRVKTIRVLGVSEAAFTALVYWLNPYSILTCVGLSTLALDHLFITASLLASLRGKKEAAGASLAVAILLSPYAVSLLPPVSLLLNQSQRRLPYTSSIFATAKWLAVLVAMSCAVMRTIVPPAQSWEWIQVCVCVCVCVCMWVRVCLCLCLCVCVCIWDASASKNGDTLEGL
jgi:hypothetical protein